MKPLFLALSLAAVSGTAEAKTIHLGPAGEKGSVFREDVAPQAREGTAPQAREGAAPRVAEAGRTLRVSFRLRKLRTKNTRLRYAQVSVDSLPLTSEPGMPALPFQAVTLDAAISDVRVIPILGDAVTVNVGRVLPAQAEPCRCATPAPAFTDHVDSYTAPTSGFVLQSLGDFRGQALTRVLLYPHKYDPASGILTLYPNARFEIHYGASPVKARAECVYDYLVITPRSLMSGLASWVDWKQSSQNLRFNVVAYEDIGSPGAEALKTWIHNEYARANFKYALLVGGKAKIPQLTVETSTDKNTPSDLPYFTMGGDGDVVPDVLAGRVVTDNADTLARITKKWMDYERDAVGAGAGPAEVRDRYRAGGASWHRDIGIASNQGSGPSDAEYITSIQDKLKSAFGADPVYLFQNNPDSNPASFNNQLAAGAMWVTYIGHGSGTDWPSFGTTYNIPAIQQLRNASAVKPVWIDVACLNGALEPGAAGANLTTAADPSGAATGVTAYLGGTVLVSWHPPAIFARGVVYKLADMLAPTLGDAIQAGQRYLTENTSNVIDIQSNQRWYHLQGDPSLRLRLK